MARIKMKVKNEPQSIYHKNCGIEVISDEKLRSFDTWFAFEQDNFSSYQGGLPNPNVFWVPLDEISMDITGKITVKQESIRGRSTNYLTALRPNVSSYQMYEGAFVQLLNLLKIPMSFAKRLNPDMLIVIVNKMLQDNFDTSVGIRITNNNLIISFFHGNKKNNISVYTLFDGVFSMLEKFGKLSKIRSHGTTTAAYWRLRDNGEKKQADYIEVYASDSFAFNPAITYGIRFGNAICLFKEYSQSLDTSMFVTQKQLINAAKSMSIDVIGSVNWPNVSLNINPDMIIPEDRISTIEDRSKKMMKTPLNIDKKSTLIDIIYILGKRQVKSDNLNEIRRIAFFGGWLCSQLNEK